MKSFIRNLSAPVEFFLVIFVCFWWGIIGSIVAVASHSWRVSSAVEFTDSGALTLVIIELSGLAVTFWSGRIRGWSFQSFGLQPTWRSTGAGFLLCLAAGSAIGVSVLLANAIFPGSAQFLPVASHVSVPLLILASAINPVFEETIEIGYFVRSLERYGMWAAVLASALFRAFLHAYQGANAIVVVFPIGLIFGFVYWKWRQLWPLIVAHALFDLYALFPRSHAA
ncbi:CPBP family intramembrane glutamic endopeptidase [Chthoniobacter flavus]|nr:CPBP family intramembrane glutamic endopeptidase [Chthoniobacter flavus]